jgi:hypothetical protein
VTATGIVPDAPELCNASSSELRKSQPAWILGVSRQNAP